MVLHAISRQLDEVSPAELVHLCADAFAPKHSFAAQWGDVGYGFQAWVSAGEGEDNVDGDPSANNTHAFNGNKYIRLNI